MPIQVLVNLLIGILWMFLQDSWTFLTFLSGYLFGILVLFILRKFLRSKFYLITLYAVFRLVIIFIHELTVSSILVIREVLRPKITVKPGFFKLETDLEGDWEVTLLALLITLTPGSVVCEISNDNKTFFVHAMDIPEISNAVLQSKYRFEEAIKKVTR